MLAHIASGIKQEPLLFCVFCHDIGPIQTYPVTENVPRQQAL